MSGRWSDTGQFPQRMKEEVKENAKHCAVCGDPNHQTREHDKIKRAEMAARNPSSSEPVVPYRKRRVVMISTSTKKGKSRFMESESEKQTRQVLTKRARRLAKKAFPSKPHDWRFHVYTEVKPDAV